uniref:hypothetical protein n=1 Tax=Methanoculleus chikugoensis TaxID=118126 RepID=UPI001FB2837E
LLRLRPELRAVPAAWARGRPGARPLAERPKRRRDDRSPEEFPFEGGKGDGIDYSPVPSEPGDEGHEKSRPPGGAPETPTPREEHEISKKGEERIARQQVEGDE